MKRVAAVAVLAGMTAVLFAVHDGDHRSAQAAVRHAAARTVDAGSSRFTMSIDTPLLTAHLVPDYEVEGLMDYVHDRGRISYWGDTEMIFDGDVTYMQWPMPWRHEKPWVRSDGSADDVDVFDVQERAMHDPAGLLAFLTGASDDVRDAGSEDVRGTPTTHYEGTLDLQKVVDNAPPAKRAELQDWLDFIAKDEPTKVPFGLWVDGGGVAHRLRIDDQGGASVTIEYYDFGVPVEIRPPPASEIMSGEEFVTEMEQHAGDPGCEGTRTETDSDAGTGGLFSCMETTVGGG